MPPQGLPARGLLCGPSERGGGGGQTLEQARLRLAVMIWQNEGGLSIYDQASFSLALHLLLPHQRSIWRCQAILGSTSTAGTRSHLSTSILF